MLPNTVKLGKLPLENKRAFLEMIEGYEVGCACVAGSKAFVTEGTRMFDERN